MCQDQILTSALEEQGKAEGLIYSNPFGRGEWTQLAEHLSRRRQDILDCPPRTDLEWLPSREYLEHEMSMYYRYKEWLCTRLWAVPWRQDETLAVLDDLEDRYHVLDMAHDCRQEWRLWYNRAMSLRYLRDRCGPMYQLPTLLPVEVFWRE